MAQPSVEIVHALPGRVHLRALALAGNRDVLARVVTLLAREPANERVSGRDITGSIVVESEEGALDAAEIARKLSSILGSTRDEAGRPLAEPVPPSTRGPTRVARAVAHAVAGINRDVSASLGHHADLGTLFSIALGGSGLFQVLLSEELPGPSWFNALWWSLRSFMTFNVDALESEMAGGNGAAERDGPKKPSRDGNP